MDVQSAIAALPERSRSEGERDADPRGRARLQDVLARGPMNFLDERLPALFWNKLNPCPITGCWLWCGSVNKKGYGSHGRRAPHSGSQLTHRYTYEVAIGALPPGTELDHRVCSTRSCANPAHLEAVPHLVNVRRGAAKKQRCKRGHELAGANLMPTKHGSRCRACSRLESKERYVPKARRPRPRKALCKYGHPKVDNGRRMVCPTCTSAAWRNPENVRA